MHLENLGPYNPLCISKLVLIDREDIPYPDGLTCKPCISTISPVVDCIGSNVINPDFYSQAFIQTDFFSLWNASSSSSSSSGLLVFPLEYGGTTTCSIGGVAYEWFWGVPSVTGISLRSCTETGCLEITMRNDSPVNASFHSQSSGDPFYLYSTNSFIRTNNVAQRSLPINSQPFSDIRGWWN